MTAPPNPHKPVSETKKYYTKFFSPFGDNVLFEIYDVRVETFVTFSGTGGSVVMNKRTIIEKLTELSLVDSPLFSDIIILIHNHINIDFDNPVFIGNKDKFQHE